MHDELCIVQFPHPGREATPNHKTHEYSWTKTDESHRRRFLRQKGNCIDAQNRLFENKNLVFWGEWEAEGTAEQVTSMPGTSEPRWICDPWYHRPQTVQQSGSSCQTGTGGCMNTDPFVFGPHFLYSNCKQLTAGRPNQLQFLLPGSLILFGSRINWEFHLDTVFVVGDETDRIPYRLSDDWNRVRDLTSQQFMDVTALFTDPDQSFTLYRGAMYDANNPEKPYCFVPCRINGESGAFARPVIDLMPYINPRKAQGYKLTHQWQFISPDQSIDIWNKIREQVLEKKLLLGTRFTLPACRS